MKITMKDEKRVQVIQAVMVGKISKGQASQVLDRSLRQVNRLVGKLAEHGVRGLIHGNRGRPSAFKLEPSKSRKILELVKGKYQDVNDTHLRELLDKREGICLGRETLRALLRGSGLGPKRKRKPRVYRGRRERKAAFGCMIQIDASRHDWLKGRGPMMTLVGGKDDATGFVWAQFVPSETTWAYCFLMQDIAQSHGLPMSLYADRHSIFHVNREPGIIEQLNNQLPLSQFGRAMTELGVTLIKAWSPQAKGRIERNWGIFQDRLVVELRLAGVRNQDEANDFLKRFLVEYNKQFMVPARSKESVFKKAPAPEKLNRILCLKETRVVNKDHTISFEGLALQIPPSKYFRSLAKRQVEVLQLQDGSIEIVFQARCIARFSPEGIRKLMTLNNKENSEIKKVA